MGCNKIGVDDGDGDAEDQKDSENIFKKDRQNYQDTPLKEDTTF
jgi:hypothetical protein